ncbi:hypothetical protein IEQ11_16385 [Lysobacter capsici]|uniref:hypothetical protein n=1 Tax=Lysobacter capsici TaxID=435897 RepID=UPI0017862385|nr:hypothetical protein [Lysobacter capsici]UOF13317.1 hypothetical protein IEQ11_16385 [Lysobacter capsici]
MATQLDPKQITLVATFVSAGVANGASGWMIVGGKLKKIPPRGIKQLQAVSQMLNAADAVGNARLAAQLQQTAIEVANEAVH